MNESKPLTKEQEGFANSFLDGVRFVMETKSADKLTKKVISMIDAKYEQGKADGEMEMFEKFSPVCGYKKCEYYALYDGIYCQGTLETCPIAKGGK